MKHKDSFKTLDALKKALIKENENLGITKTTFAPVSDNVNLVCEILTSDIIGAMSVDGHIYKSFDKNMKPCFIVRLYDDL